MHVPLLGLSLQVSQWVDHITQYVQRFVDIAPFPQPVALHLCRLLTLVSCQINEMHPREPVVLYQVTLTSHLNVHGEHAMRPRRFDVHVRARYVPVLFALRHDLNGLGEISTSLLS